MSWILIRVDLGDVLVHMADTRLVYIPAAFGLNMVGWAISVTRWRILLRANAVEVPVRRVLESYLSAIFFNNFLPSTVGGDTLRVYDSWRWGAGRLGAVTVVAVDRLLGILALLAYATVALWLAPHVIHTIPLLPLWLGLGAVAVAALAATTLVLVPAIHGRLPQHLPRLPEPTRRPLEKISFALHAYRAHPGALRKALALSLLLQLNVVFHYFLIAKALSLPVDLAAFFLIIPISLAVMSVPFSVNAIGIRENVFVFFLAMYGIGTSEALAFAWVSFALILFQGIVGGVTFALRQVSTRGSSPAYSDPAGASDTAARSRVDDTYSP